MCIGAAVQTFCCEIKLEMKWLEPHLAPMSLLDLLVDYAGEDAPDWALAAQARAVAEFLHAKIVRYSLSSGLAHDAARQMLRFARHFRAPPAAASFDSA